MKIKEFAARIAELAYPPKCAACGELLDLSERGALCIKCRSEWEKEKLRFCSRCGDPHVWCQCGATVRDSGTIIEEYIHLVPYSVAKNTVGKRIILRAKKKDQRRVFEFLADEMSRLAKVRLGEEYIQNAVVAAAPRSRSSVRKYGFDQTSYLAKEIAERLGTAKVKVIKRRGGKVQKGLDRYARVGNAEKSYCLNAKYADTVFRKNVLLVDDVVTTGSTVLACADILAEAGAISAAVLSVAHSEYNKRGSLPQKEMQ